MHGSLAGLTFFVASWRMSPVHEMPLLQRMMPGCSASHCLLLRVASFKMRYCCDAKIVARAPGDHRAKLKKFIHGLPVPRFLRVNNRVAILGNIE